MLPKLVLNSWAQAIFPLESPKVGGSLEVKSSRPAWPTGRNPTSTKNTKISRAWWHALVIPATPEVRQENHLNSGGGSCSDLRSRHCTPT
uniref:Uncharacterized protein n=1 Tax=Macaca mulatta TaxID=9544 RepID=A0A5F8ACP9_MACMU